MIFQALGVMIWLKIRNLLIAETEAYLKNSLHESSFMGAPHCLWKLWRLFVLKY